MGREEQDGWCILRTAGPRTLRLAKSLAKAEIEAWTPVETQVKRKGPARDRVPVDAPVMPTFVFARASALPYLAGCVRSPINPHPAFSIFRFNGRIPLISDRDIVSLRRIEERAKMRRLKGERRIIPIGTHIKLDEGSFAGLSGIVEESDGKFALVAFGGSFRVRIATFLLRTDGVQNGPLPGPEAVISGIAARAA